MMTRRRQRAAALQREVDAAISGGTSAAVQIRLDGVYNFSRRSLLLRGCRGLELRGSGPATTTLLFSADTGGPGAIDDRRSIDPGVNATACANSTLAQLSIDYSPKPRTCMCFSRKADGKPPYPVFRPAPSPDCPPASQGITLHF